MRNKFRRRHATPGHEIWYFITGKHLPWLLPGGWGLGWRFLNAHDRIKLSKIKYHANKPLLEMEIMSKRNIIIPNKYIDIN